MSHINDVAEITLRASGKILYNRLCREISKWAYVFKALSVEKKASPSCGLNVLSICLCFYKKQV